MPGMPLDRPRLRRLSALLACSLAFSSVADAASKRVRAIKPPTSQSAAAATAAGSAGASPGTSADTSAAARQLPGGLPVPVLTALQKAGIPLSSTSFYVVEVGAPAPLVSWNAQAAMNPASTMKLVTTFAGLQLLGPSFRWQTSLYAERQPDENGVVGNLYLRGHGDPKLVPEEMARLVTNAKRSGVETIAGDLILDRSYFVEGLDNGQTIDGEVQRAYNVKPDALLYSFKTLSFTLRPAPGGQGVEVAATPALAQLRIDNRLTLTNGRCGDWRSQAGPAILPRADGTVQAVFEGRYAADCGEQSINIAALTHDDFIGGGFVAEWLASGGQFARPPRIRAGRVPRLRFRVARHYGPPLADIIRDINKFSNNVMARQLFLTIGAEIEDGGPGSTATAARAIQEWLSHQGLDMPTLVLDNGSGLSREERISAYDMARLLQQALASEAATVFLQSLPVLGVDGTLRNRLTGSPAAGHGYLKTGTLADVKAIAGYVDAMDGRRYVVVNLVNHDNAARAQEAQDALLEWVYRGQARAAQAFR
ncbi:D-alanyl-D-alanine carboxypeptidase/D-alanyl-D-alanine-endopeptidase [Cupriavidus sp. AU9028]|uniref:D-alanyl-D-alanine carboxypeptidase/D-alanyl-D-alanine endopeptidase n=1 Tax=Cupriavidus sp. AU9028 TaxID=2871157 RepID=UPI001C93C2B8|nr:D-alanyl-D-alanine carboxypeptidase/D-alanyl-D-alanine-endopeptidase [Cupriavidus sp. AU9028]MBY4895459.1 D-alanyl-D-alanine carboxypeptidase/D-alanyl-D-alanine-endopeptidase [Cupriavidus sp. AU9028]